MIKVVLASLLFLSVSQLAAASPFGLPFAGVLQFGPISISAEYQPTSNAFGIDARINSDEIVDFMSLFIAEIPGAPPFILLDYDDEISFDADGTTILDWKPGDLDFGTPIIPLGNDVIRMFTGGLYDTSEVYGTIRYRDFSGDFTIPFSFDELGTFPGAPVPLPASFYLLLSSLMFMRRKF